MPDNPSSQADPISSFERGPLPRYCGVCGERFAEPEARCPNCGTVWQPPSAVDFQTLAALLTDLPRLHNAGVLDQPSYMALRATYESWLALLRPAVPASHPIEPVNADRQVPGVAASVHSSGIPASRAPTLTQWTATRQADILFYLGAFLLSVAALIFVGYQGQALTGIGRVAVLFGYTATFLTLGLRLPKWERVREAGAVFLALGALLVPINAVALRTQVLGGSIPDNVLWLVGSSLTAALYFVLALRGFGRAYRLPGALAGLVGWGALASILNLPAGAYGAWYAAGTATVYLSMVLLAPTALAPIEPFALIIGAGSLLYAHGAAAAAVGPSAQLPAAYVLTLVWVAAGTARRPSAFLRGLLYPLTAMLASAALWAAGIAIEWWTYPWLAASLAVLVTEPWWQRRVPRLPNRGHDGEDSLADAPSVRPGAAAGAGNRTGLLLALALAAPLFFSLSRLASDSAISGLTAQPVHGLIIHLLAAVIVLLAALRVNPRAASAVQEADHALRPRFRRVTIIDERRVLLGLSSLLLSSAVAYLNAWAGLHGAERAWLYAGLGTASWAGIALFARLEAGLDGILAPPAVAALTLAGILAADDVTVATIIFALGAAGPAVAAQALRRWSLWGLSAVFSAVAIAFAWNWAGWGLAGLSLAYLTAAAILWAGLASRRRYELSERGVVIALLSWGTWALTLGTACATLIVRAANLVPGQMLVQSPEWSVLALIAALSSAALTLEGFRLARPALWILGAASFLLAGLLTIAIAQPANVQAYTLPVGLYLVAIGMVAARRLQTTGGPLSLNEALLVLGLLFLVLPPAKQSFEPGGGRYALQLIAEGILFLALGIGLTARWLVAGAVLTLSGVALRWLLLAGSQAPYWLTLGIVGMGLLGVGVLLLLHRDRWERLRSSLARWWLEAPQGGESSR
ncbi:MAG: hypothetical protein ACR2PL_08675 [Dehalococcoidia bacterium]